MHEGVTSASVTPSTTFLKPISTHPGSILELDVSTTSKGQTAKEGVGGSKPATTGKSPLSQPSFSQHGTWPCFTITATTTHQPVHSPNLETCIECFQKASPNHSSHDGNESSASSMPSSVARTSIWDAHQQTVHDAEKTKQQYASHTAQRSSSQPTTCAKCCHNARLYRTQKSTGTQLNRRSQQMFDGLERRLDRVERLVLPRRSSILRRSASASSSVSYALSSAGQDENEAAMLVKPPLGPRRAHHHVTSRRFNSEASSEVYRGRSTTAATGYRVDDCFKYSASATGTGHNSVSLYEDRWKPNKQFAKKPSNFSVSSVGNERRGRSSLCTDANERQSTYKTPAVFCRVLTTRVEIEGPQPYGVVPAVSACRCMISKAPAEPPPIPPQACKAKKACKRKQQPPKQSESLPMPVAEASSVASRSNLPMQSSPSTMPDSKDHLESRFVEYTLHNYHRAPSAIVSHVQRQPWCITRHPPVVSRAVSQVNSAIPQVPPRDWEIKGVVEIMPAAVRSVAYPSHMTSLSHQTTTPETSRQAFWERSLEPSLPCRRIVSPSSRSLRTGGPPHSATRSSSVQRVPPLWLTQTSHASSTAVRCPGSLLAQRQPRTPPLLARPVVSCPSRPNLIEPRTPYLGPQVASPVQWSPGMMPQRNVVHGN